MRKVISALFVSMLLITPCFAEGVSLTVTDSVAVFRSYIGNADSVMLDLRPEAAYMGWRLDGAVRGGHVAGAVDFPVSWLKLADDEKLDDILTQKGVSEGKTVILYGADKIDSRLLDGLARKNVKRAVLFTLPASKWTSDETIPMYSYPNYRLLVYPEWLKALMDGKTPENYDGRPFKVFEASWGEEKTS